MSRRFDKPLAIDAVMDRSMKNGFFYFIANRARMSEIWRDTVGPKVIGKTLIKSFEVGRLEVWVKSPAHLERYRYFLEKWRKRMNIEFGDEVVTEIVMKVGAI